MSKDKTPEVTLARDEFTVERRRLDGHPEAVNSKTRIDVADDYDNVTTWVLDLYRLEGEVTALVQVGRPDGYVRLVIPAAVTERIARHFASLSKKLKKKAGRRMRRDVAALSGEEFDQEAGGRRRKQGKA